MNCQHGVSVHTSSHVLYVVSDVDSHVLGGHLLANTVMQHTARPMKTVFKVLMTYDVICFH